jgi:hypothetical protein
LPDWAAMREHFLHYYSKGKLPFRFWGRLIEWAYPLFEESA